MDPIEERIKQEIQSETAEVIDTIHSYALSNKPDAVLLACLSYAHIMLTPSPEKDRIEALIEDLVPFALNRRYRNEIEKN